MPANNLISNAYSFSGILLVDKFKTEITKANKDQTNNNIYFQIGTHTLPSAKRGTKETVRVQGVPTNQLGGIYDFEDYSLDVFLSSDYMEYRVMFQWLLDTRKYREYLHHTPGLLSDATLYILNSKLDKIALGIRFKKAFPLDVNSIKFEKTINPLRLTINLSYLDIEFLDPSLYANFNISTI